MRPHDCAASVSIKRGIFYIVLSLTFIDCQLFSPSCTYTCSWNTGSCCTQIGCDYCDLTSFSCQIEIIYTGIYGTVGWCAVEVNDTLQWRNYGRAGGAVAPRF